MTVYQAQTNDIIPPTHTPLWCHIFLPLILTDCKKPQSCMDDTGVITITIVVEDILKVFPLKHLSICNKHKSSNQNKENNFQ